MAVRWEAEAPEERRLSDGQLCLCRTPTQQDGEEGQVAPARRTDAPSRGLGSSRGVLRASPSKDFFSSADCREGADAIGEASDCWWRCLGDAAGWRGGLGCAGQAHRCPYPRSGLPSRGLGSVPVEGFLLISRVSGGSRRHRRGIGLLVALPSKIIGLTMILPSHCRMEGHK